MATAASPFCYSEGKSDVKNRVSVSSSSSSKVSATQQVRSDIDSSVDSNRMKIFHLAKNQFEILSFEEIIKKMDYQI